MTEHKNRPLPQDFDLPLQGVDTHAHLDMPELRGNIPEIIDRSRRAGVEFIGNVFLGPQAYANHRIVLASDAKVFFILGMHPHEASKVDDHCLVQTQSAMEGDKRIKALGEIGLDYYRDYAPHAVQQKAFKVQLELARDMDIPVVIHSRAAEEETLHILDQAGFARRPLLWHCFGGGPDLAAEIVHRGWRISVPGTVTFPKAKDLHKAVQTLPLSAMVLETDCPFLAPEPYRGKRNEPALTVFTAQKVAQLKNEDIVGVWEQTGRNAREFFGLGEYATGP